MRRVKINGPEDLTEENIAIFREGLEEIQKQNAQNRALMESGKPSEFCSVESYMEYYDAIPFVEFDKKFRSGESQ